MSGLELRLCPRNSEHTFIDIFFQDDFLRLTLPHSISLSSRVRHSTKRRDRGDDRRRESGRTDDRGAADKETFSFSSRPSLISYVHATLASSSSRSGRGRARGKKEKMSGKKERERLKLIRTHSRAPTQSGQRGETLCQSRSSRGMLLLLTLGDGSYSVSAVLSLSSLSAMSP